MTQHIAREQRTIEDVLASLPGVQTHTEEILKKPIRVELAQERQLDHYLVTPYSFVPKIGQKFAPDIYTDMGQGLITCLADIHERMDPANSGFSV